MDGKSLKKPHISPKHMKDTEDRNPSSSDVHALTDPTKVSALDYLNRVFNYMIGVSDMNEAKSVCEISQVTRVAQLADCLSLVGFKLGNL